ncbi:MAG TPA: hypothetical protein V6C98_12465 [Thermosynechococcaceae cyanobacterium]
MASDLALCRSFTQLTRLKIALLQPMGDRYNVYGIVPAYFTCDRGDRTSQNLQIHPYK